MHKLAFLLLALLSTPWTSKAQVSTAFEKNVYFPDLTNKMETDSIYGSVEDQHMGGGMINMGPWVDTKYNQTMISGLTAKDPSLYSVRSPNYDLHKLVKRKSDLQEFGEIRARGHFRNTMHLDLLSYVTNVSQQRIYWADDSGFYSADRYTDLRSSKVGTLPPGIGQRLHAYVDEFDGDSLDDIVTDIYVSNFGQSSDSSYLAFYSGKNLYHLGSDAFPSRMLNSDIPRNSFYADFRGTGRKDLISWDRTSSSIFFYKNDGLMSLESLRLSFARDTLMTSWQNPAIDTKFGLNSTFAMSALPKNSFDASLDWMPNFKTNDDRSFGICVFRGGPEFGSKRLFLEDAELVIRHPGKIDLNAFFGMTWPENLVDCGDMTGTGNRVLHVSGSGLEAGYAFLYVLGRAANELIDVYGVNVNFGYNKADTITANGDLLQDIILGMPGYTSDDDLATLKITEKGSIQIWYGSDKIPVNLNPKYDVKNTARSSTPINVIQHDHVLKIAFEWPVAEAAQLRIFSVLGTTVYEQELQVLPGENWQTVELPQLSHGTYLIAIRSEHASITGSFNYL
jgi:hypothetical protein